MEAVALNPGRLVAAAVIGLVLLLVLIIKFKVQAMVAILIGAIAIGLLAGMPYEQIVTAVNDGIGNTLKGIALLVGLGSDVYKRQAEDQAPGKGGSAGGAADPADLPQRRRREAG